MDNLTEDPEYVSLPSNPVLSSGRPFQLQERWRLGTPEVYIRPFMLVHPVRWLPNYPNDAVLTSPARTLIPRFRFVKFPLVVSLLTLAPPVDLLPPSVNFIAHVPLDSLIMVINPF
jgi:hypothetical protein